MDLLTVAGWGLVYVGIGSVVAKVAYRWLYIPTCGGGNKGECLFTAFWAMLLWPVVVLIVITVGTIWAILTLLTPLGRVLAASWEWWLRD